MKQVRAGQSGGFTLIELLVVIAIIGILITIVTTVGASALAGGRGRQTQDTVRILDAAVTTYVNDVGTVPPAFVAAFAPTIAPAFEGEDYAAYPLADAVDLSGGDELNRTRINSVGLFMQSLEEVGLTDTVGSVSAEILTRWDGDADLADESGTIATGDGRQPELRTVLDAWGRPLRFVHPAWDGPVTAEDNLGNPRTLGNPGTGVRPITGDPLDAGTDFWLASNRAPSGYDPTVATDFPIETIRRNFLTDADRASWSGAGPAIGDSDGGYTVGNMPYIYSAGAGGDPSNLDDNIYTTEPRRPITPTP